MSRDFKNISYLDLRFYGQPLSLFNYNVGYKVKKLYKNKIIKKAKNMLHILFMLLYCTVYQNMK